MSGEVAAVLCAVATALFVIIATAVDALNVLYGMAAYFALASIRFAIGAALHDHQGAP